MVFPGIPSWPHSFPKPHLVPSTSLLLVAFLIEVIESLLFSDVIGRVSRLRMQSSQRSLDVSVQYSSYGSWSPLTSGPTVLIQTGVTVTLNIIIAGALFVSAAPSADLTCNFYSVSSCKTGEKTNLRAYIVAYPIPLVMATSLMSSRKYRSQKCSACL